ncbi:hypothetical protein [Hymenobacter sp. IS2118]|uniref:hypothetical protein n=1 Tax=Hymenobacter sp. IS2118 TaxID=1505605 RepID=UPI000552C318|nr:hypothetical protein [Hymenobacter sp. IS2118]
MKLNLYCNKDLACAMLINVDAEQQNGRHIDHWELGSATNPNMTYVKNPNITALNPYKYLRVRFLFTIMSVRKNKDFFCVNDIVKVDGLEIDFKY